MAPTILTVLLVAAGLGYLFKREMVYEYQHALHFKGGRFAGMLAPGAHWLLRPQSRVQVLDARPRLLTIPGQEVLSADNVSLKLSLLLRIRVVHPKVATLEAESFEESLYASAQIALREAIGARSIAEVLETRSEISAQLQTAVAPAATALGVELMAISIKDIMFPGPLKEAFSQTARAKQDAQASLERARGEAAALRSLANAARMLEGNPRLAQLRLLQTAAEADKLVINYSPDSIDKTAPED